MRTGKPSRTAQFVAYNRALGTLAPQVPGFSDPIAVEFLPDNWKEKVHKTRRSLAGRPGKSPYPFWLGAGFDARAWRLNAFEDATVFEVDHPATQAVKRARAAAIPATSRQVHFVATDFHARDMAASLRAAGYDVSRPTFWLWEGVPMYLRPEAVAANLEALAALSAPGSHLALTYMSKDRGRIPRSLFLALMGEPVRSAYTPAEITELAKTYGWMCTADSGIRDWLRDLTPAMRLTKRQAGLQWFERIWVARLA
jgi:O-methyltransferase involved in polyketide biosynthesis